ARSSLTPSITIRQVPTAVVRDPQIWHHNAKSQSLNTDQGSSDFYDQGTTLVWNVQSRVSIPQYRSGQFRRAGVNGLTLNNEGSQSLNTDQGSSDRATLPRPATATRTRSQSLNTDQGSSDAHRSDFLRRAFRQSQSLNTDQ